MIKKRPPRVLQLNVPPPKVDKRGREYVFYKFKKLNDGVEKRWRYDDKTLYVERNVDERSKNKRRRLKQRWRCRAKVDWRAIFEEVKLEQEYVSLADWGCDGWDHRMNGSGGGFPDLDRASNVFQDRHGPWLVEFTKEAGLPDAKDFYHHGTSKHVAAELAAAALRNNMKSLLKYLQEGVEVWNASLNFQGYKDSCCHIEDEKYAREEVGFELVETVADAMTQDGYIVVGLVDELLRRKRAGQRNRFNYNLNFQNWNAPRRSCDSSCGNDKNIKRLQKRRAEITAAEEAVAKIEEEAAAELEHAAWMEANKEFAQQTDAHERRNAKRRMQYRLRKQQLQENGQ